MARKKGEVVNEEEGSHQEPDLKENPGVGTPPPLHSSLMPPTMLIPPGRVAMVEGNAIVRRVGMLLANGSRFANHPTINFGVHTGLLTLMHGALNRWITSIPTEVALRQEQEQIFFHNLEDYLQQAYGRIPHALGPAEAENSLIQIKLLVDQVNAQGRTDGFEQVARYLLLLAHAPLDRF